eukprot:4411400-Heterocapsa_arctica.AAC.1
MSTMIRALDVPSRRVFRMSASLEKLPSANAAMAFSREMRMPYPCSRKRFSSAAASSGFASIDA